MPNRRSNEGEAPSRPRAARQSRRQAPGATLAPALAPFVDLCLELGLTSPEMERVLRAVFVERAERVLSSAPRRRRRISDVRIGLIVGVHRNLVRQIRETPTRVQLRGVQRRHRTSALLEAWSSDWTFLTSSGQPRDLPIYEADEGPSFEHLVKKYLPGVSTGTAVAELRRSGAVRLLPDEYVRLRTRVPRPSGLTEAALAAAVAPLQALTCTVLHNLTSSENHRLCDGIEEIAVDPTRLALLRQTITRRARSFLDSLASELRAEALATGAPGSVTLGLKVFSYEKGTEKR